MLTEAERTIAYVDGKSSTVREAFKARLARMNEMLAEAGRRLNQAVAMVASATECWGSDGQDFERGAEAMDLAESIALNVGERLNEDRLAPCAGEIPGHWLKQAFEAWNDSDNVGEDCVDMMTRVGNLTVAELLEQTAAWRAARRDPRPPQSPLPARVPAATEPAAGAAAPPASPSLTVLEALNLSTRRVQQLIARARRQLDFAESANSHAQDEDTDLWIRANAAYLAKQAIDTSGMILDEWRETSAHDDVHGLGYSNPEYFIDRAGQIEVDALGEDGSVCPGGDVDNLVDMPIAELVRRVGAKDSMMPAETKA